jgi:hypothetical protein
MERVVSDRAAVSGIATANDIATASGLAAAAKYLKRTAGRFAMMIPKARKRFIVVSIDPITIVGKDIGDGESLNLNGITDVLLSM